MSKEHEVDGRDCWCSPRVEQECPECDGGEPSCWRCGGTGWVSEYDPTAPVVVIHNEDANG